MVDLAIAKYRNEVFHILADVEETEDSATRSIFRDLAKVEGMLGIFTSAVVSSL